MPYADNGGVRIWWEEIGSGEPVLAIMGLSFTLEMWHRTAPVLAEKFRVIVFDNRGVGRSSVPGGPYRITAMASDALAVLDAARVQRAHIMGASMGGMIAQELALGHPDRVRSLILGCTWSGLIHGKFPDLRHIPGPATWSTLSPEGKMRALIPMLYTPDTPAERIERDIELRLRHIPGRRGYNAQLFGTLLWRGSHHRLSQLRVPVKVLHGELDKLVPVENGRRLAARIPGAQLAVIPRAGHVFTTDQPEIANREAMEFFERVNGGP